MNSTEHLARFNLTVDSLNFKDLADNTFILRTISLLMHVTSYNARKLTEKANNFSSKLCAVLSQPKIFFYRIGNGYGHSKLDCIIRSVKFYLLYELSSSKA